MVIILSLAETSLLSYSFIDGPNKRRGAFRPRLGIMAEEQNTDLTTEIEGQDHGVRLPPDLSLIHI